MVDCWDGLKAAEKVGNSVVMMDVMLAEMVELLGRL
jgi:hypothetical protein